MSNPFINQAPWKPYQNQLNESYRKPLSPIKGMHCVMCAQSIEGALKRGWGVFEAYCLRFRIDNFYRMLSRTLAWEAVT